jgi:hypothetical protein
MVMVVMVKKLLSWIAWGLLVLSGCSDPNFDCVDHRICSQVKDAYDIARFPIQGVQSHVFDYGNDRYHLVHFEYGAANDCPAGCFYSHLCTFMADNQTQDAPSSFSFSQTAEYLFDPRRYCPAVKPDGYVQSGSGCQMPAFSLPVLRDSVARQWILQPDDRNDELRWCREPLRQAISLGEL